MWNTDYFFRYNGNIIDTVHWLLDGGQGESEIKGGFFRSPGMTRSSVKLSTGCSSVVSVNALAWAF